MKEKLEQLIRSEVPFEVHKIQSIQQNVHKVMYSLKEHKYMHCQFFMVTGDEGMAGQANSASKDA